MPLSRDTHEVYPRRRAGTDASDTEQLFLFPRMDPLPHQQQQHYGAGFNTSSQSLIRHHRNNLSTFSLSSHISLPNRVSTLEAYELIYGNGAAQDTTPTESAERLYEAHAGMYENPLITASSRQVIGDINALTRQLRELDVPRPLAMFKTLFRPSHSHGEASSSWFQALRVWSEIDEIYDSESFDGHRQSIIEHTLHVLILPGLHSGIAPDLDVSSVMSLPATGVHAPAPKPVLAIPGLRRLPLPSPLHLKLHVVSRLAFNEQGRITRHRDFYDVRDVLALVPGVRTAQWIGTRAAAQGLAWAARLAGWVFGRKKETVGSDYYYDIEDGVTPVASPLSAHSFRADMNGLNALGLHLSESGTGSSASKLSMGARRGPPASRAPDVDRDD